MDAKESGAHEIKSAVKARYASALQGSGTCRTKTSSGCCGTGQGAQRRNFATAAGYTAEELAALPADAVEHSFGCGNPLAFEAVQPGQVVLDIGSGAGIDCFLAAEKVGPTGRVIGLDMTPEMIARARRNAQEAGVTNVEFRMGDAERIPVDDASVDWVISNCVINLSPDKPAVFREIARALRPGGRIAISDIVAAELPGAVRQSREAWTGCLAGAISEEDYLAGLRAAGLEDVQVAGRTFYDASQLKTLFASSCCGVGEVAGQDAGALAAAAAGKIWSAKFEGRKPRAAEEPASVFSPAVAELVAIGAAIASNCEPCFRHHYDQARKLGVSRADMAHAVETAQSVKETPARAMLALADRYLGKERTAGEEKVANRGACCASSQNDQPAKCC